MKTIILTMAVLLSSTAALATCSYDELNSDGTDTMTTVATSITKLQFNEHFKGLDYNKCKDSMIESTLMTINGNEYVVIMPDSNDECDGGNSVGIVKDVYTKKIVAELHDGEYTCK